MHALKTGDVIGIAMFLVVASLVIQAIRKGGLKGAAFGARIEERVGEVSVTAPRLLTSSLKVHRLGGDPQREIGLELVSKSFASYQMMPIALSAEEAQALMGYLQAALRGTSRPPLH